MLNLYSWFWFFSCICLSANIYLTKGGVGWEYWSQGTGKNSLIFAWYTRSNNIDLIWKSIAHSISSCCHHPSCYRKIRIRHYYRIWVFYVVSNAKHAMLLVFSNLWCKYIQPIQFQYLLLIGRVFLCVVDGIHSSADLGFICFGGQLIMIFDDRVGEQRTMVVNG